MKQNDVMAAIEILKSSNVRLNYHIKELKSAANKAKHSKAEKEYYNVLANCKAEHEAVELAISALEKQLIEPPEHKVHEKYKSLGKNYYCQCGVMFVDFERNGTNFCGNCGQRLKEDCNG